MSEVGGSFVSFRIARWIVIGLTFSLISACSLGGGGQPAAKSGGTGNSANPPDVASKLDSYYQKARSSGEKKVVHYGGVGAEYDEIITAFQSHYPDIEVERVLLRGPEMIQRLQAEAASGKVIANAGSHGQTTMTTLDKDGMLQQWEGPPTAA